VTRYPGAVGRTLHALVAVTVLVACTRARPPQGATAPSNSATAATDAAPPCHPYLEATGVSYDLVPSAFFTVEEGERLVVVGLDPGVVDEELGERIDGLVVAPASMPSLRATAPQAGVRAFFASRTDLGDGVVARRGAAGIVTGVLERDRFTIETVGEVDLVRAWDVPYLTGATANSLERVAPCSALATSRPAPPPPWVPGRPAILTDPTDLVTDAGVVLENQAYPGALVDVLARLGSRARIAMRREGYVITGWVEASVVDEDGTEDQTDGGGGYTGRPWRGVASWKQCRGRVTLRGDAPVTSGRVYEDDRVTLPARDRDLEVRLRGTYDRERLIEIVAPYPGVAKLVAWADLADLSGDCAP